MVLKETILTQLKQVMDPDLNQDIVTLGFVKDLEIDGSQVSFRLELTTPACPVKENFVNECKKVLQVLPDISDVQVTLSAQAPKERPGPNLANLSQIGSIIVVSSCKGGVGKSTVAAMIAKVFQAEGLRVGLLDADIYGPSLPILFNLKHPQVQMEGKELFPVDADGLKLMSMGFLMEDQPAVLRGPIIANYVQQILLLTRWGELDYLIIDMPPGTGDIQLTLTQTAAMDGTVIVTTPHSLSLADVAKGILMFEKVKVPVLGVVENMSHFECDGCGKKHSIFSHSTQSLKDRFGLQTLAELPMAPQYADIHKKTIDEFPEALRTLGDNLHRQVGMQRIRKNTLPRIESSHQEIQINWPEGSNHALPAKKVRAACRCARCVDEWTGKPLLDPNTLTEDIHAVKIEPLGNYAVSIVWSDGHASGIYTYKHLETLCLDPSS